MIQDDFSPNAKPWSDEWDTHAVSWAPFVYRFDGGCALVCTDDEVMLFKRGKLKASYPLSNLKAGDVIKLDTTGKVFVNGEEKHF